MKPLMKLVRALIAARPVPWGSGPREPRAPPSQGHLGHHKQTPHPTLGCCSFFFLMKMQALNISCFFTHKTLLMLINQDGSPPILQTYLSAASLARSSASGQLSPGFFPKHVGHLHTDELSFKGKKNPSNNSRAKFSRAKLPNRRGAARQRFKRIPALF